MYSLYITATTQDILCTFVHINRTGRGGPCTPPFIFGEAHYIQFFTMVKVGQAVPPYVFFYYGPPRASSPPGAHVMGESSQLSKAYRYLRPKIKE